MHEALKRGEILDVEDLADIALQIGADVILYPERGIDGAVVDGREQARVKQPIHRGGSTPGVLEFGERKGQQGEKGNPSGQALGDRFDDLDLTGAGQDESAHPTIGIDDALKVRKKFGCSLDFVEDGAIRRMAEKGPWILGCQRPGIRVFEREIRKFRRNQAGERGFSGLAGAGDGKDGKSRQPFARRIGCNARNWPHVIQWADMPLHG